MRLTCWAGKRPQPLQGVSGLADEVQVCLVAHRVDNAGARSPAAPQRAAVPLGPRTTQDPTPCAPDRLSRRRKPSSASEGSQSASSVNCAAMVSPACSRMSALSSKNISSGGSSRFRRKPPCASNQHETRILICADAPLLGSETQIKLWNVLLIKRQHLLTGIDRRSCVNKGTRAQEPRLRALCV